MFQVRYELAASQRYQWGPWRAAGPLAGRGYRTQSIRDGTAPAGLHLCRRPRPGLAPIHWHQCHIRGLAAGPHPGRAGAGPTARGPGRQPSPNWRSGAPGAAAGNTAMPAGDGR